MCRLEGKDLCKKLNDKQSHNFKKYRVIEDDTIYIGYKNSLGLLFVPFGEWIEVYGDGEYENAAPVTD